MSVLDSVKTTSKKVISSSEDYVDATQDYFELKAFQQITLSIALVAKILLVGGLCFFGVVLLLIAGILTWGEYLGNTNLALLYSSLIIFTLSGLIYLLRKPLIDSKIIQKISKTFFL